MQVHIFIKGASSNVYENHKNLFLQKLRSLFFIIYFVIIKLVHQVIKKLFDFPSENEYDRIQSIFSFVDETYVGITSRCLH